MHIPHASRIVPDDVRRTFVLRDAALEQELLRLTDLYTDELFSLDPLTAVSVIFGVSRFVVDPERFIDDALEPTAARGMGAVYTATTDGAPLRASLNASQRAELLARFYAPHHAALEAATAAALDATGQCLILDGHSFPNEPLPCDLSQDRPRPEICSEPIRSTRHPSSPRRPRKALQLTISTLPSTGPTEERWFPRAGIGAMIASLR